MVLRPFNNLVSNWSPLYTHNAGKERAISAFFLFFPPPPHGHIITCWMRSKQNNIASLLTIQHYRLEVFS